MKPDIQGAAAMQLVTDWLEKLGLGQYAQRFAENEISFSVRFAAKYVGDGFWFISDIRNTVRSPAIKHAHPAGCRELPALATPPQPK